MTLDEKIGQLIMPPHFNLDQSLEFVNKYRVGSFWISKSEANKLAAELNTLQQASRLPLLIAADFEKGAGTHIDGATDLPANMSLGASRNPQLAYRAAKLTAREARAIGIHLNFAPTLDVNDNPRNPIINTRSFGEDPALVAEMGVAAIRGYQENGLLATAKHFPGHGTTSIDSHSNLGTIDRTRSKLESVELFPFKEVIQKTEISSVMVAHLWAKALDKRIVPASLSRNVITSLLRKRLKFAGLIFPDALSMGGITGKYDPDVAALKAFQAGCDVILWPGDVASTVKALKRAARSGKISLKRIDESVRRILQAKSCVGLYENRLVDAGKIPATVGTVQQYDEAREIAAQCLTLVKDDAGLLPLNPALRTLVLTLSNPARYTVMSRTLVTYPQEMEQLSGKIVKLSLSDSMRDPEVHQALELAAASDVVVIAAYVRIVLATGTVELPESHRQLVEQVIARNPKTILISFGNPYIGAGLPKLSTYVCAYDNAKAIQQAAAEALFGRLPFRGRLPITISEKMRYGDGIVSA